MFGKKLTLVGCLVAVTSATNLAAHEANARSPLKQKSSVTLAQINERSHDGWDDSYVSEQLIDKDN